MYKVRVATPSDIPYIVDVAATRMLVEEINKPQYVVKSRMHSLAAGSIAESHLWIALKNDVPVGALAATSVPNLFNPAIMCLAEVFWWVDPEHRQSRAGVLLLKAFIDESDKYDEASMSLLTTSRVLNQTLEKRGFVLREFGFHKE